MLRPLALALLLLPAAGQAAEPVRAHYAAYAAGLNVLVVDADYTVNPSDYRISTVFRTAGAFSAVNRTELTTVVQGRFAGGRAQPTRYLSTGHSRGRNRITHVDYPGGQPQVVKLEPPPEADDREPVPADQQRGTVDTLSAMAQLVRQIETTGRCDGRVMTFDGRRLAELSARTVGQETLEQTGRSSFSGPALRCDFVGKQLGGFMRDEDQATLARPQTGSAWFAPLTPGGQPVPVRVTFSTRFFGNATMYIAAPDR